MPITFGQPLRGWVRLIFLSNPECASRLWAILDNRFAVRNALPKFSPKEQSSSSNSSYIENGRVRKIEIGWAHGSIQYPLFLAEYKEEIIDSRLSLGTRNQYLSQSTHCLQASSGKIEIVDFVSLLACSGTIEIVDFVPLLACKQCLEFPKLRHLFLQRFPRKNESAPFHGAKGDCLLLRVLRERTIRTLSRIQMPFPSPKNRRIINLYVPTNKSRGACGDKL